MIRLICAVASAFALTAGAGAYEAKPVEALLDQDVRYDDAIPTPDAVTGYRLGEIIYTPDLHADYIEAVSAVSDRVSAEVIGRSHFGRPIHRVTITSPDNQARLDEVRAAQRALASPGAEPASEDHPAVVQITHGVHGSEPSGYDSAAALIYHLAAAQGDEIETLLDEVVVHLIVMINPDGANRFAQWTNMHHPSAAVADPQHREHFYEWPWGRTNHYWFDLNRQWLPVTQPEAEALVSATHDWRPNIAADLHEMGRNSTFFFSPGPTDGLHPLLSQEALELNLEMNEFLAGQLDREGALYVSEEVFDDFYLGYGSSYPGLIGAVPYLFEQSSVRGLIQETDFGTLRYDDKIGQQARVALALIRAGQARRADLHAHLTAFYEQSRRRAANDPISAYVFKSHDRGRLAMFLDLLAVHDIEAFELGEAVTVDGERFDEGDAYVVPVAQDEYRLVQGLFETRVIEDKSEFYDVSGWTQPLAYDLDYAAVRGGLFFRNLAGEPAGALDLSAPAPQRSDYAYVMEWSAFHAPRALYRFLEAGARAQVIPDEIELPLSGGGTAEPGRGAIVIPVRAQADIDAETIHQLVAQAVEEDGVTIHAVSTAYTARGSDLGGFELSPVERPEVLLVTGRGIDMYDAGEFWHLIDHEMEMPVSMIDLSELADADLDRYTHILMPNGRYGSLGEAFAGKLNGWISGGGVLIASTSAARWAAENDVSSAKIANEADETETGEDAEPVEPRAYETIDAWDAEQSISGAIFAAELDVTHPLGFGYRDEDLPVHRIGTLAFELGENPFAQPLRYADGDPLLSGYASQTNREELAGKGSVHAERKGAGSVILFADRMYYRAYFRGTAKMLMNAVFFGDDFRDSRRGPYEAGE